MRKKSKLIIICEKDKNRIDFVRRHYPDMLVCKPENCREFTPLITHRFKLQDIEKAYEIFENKLDGVIKIAITNE